MPLRSGGMEIIMKIEKIGVQLWTVRDTMNTPEEVAETFKKLKDLGYDQVQTAGCKIDYATFGKLAEDAGIEIVGTHDNFDMMRDDFEQSLANHKALNTKIMGIGGHVSETEEAAVEFAKTANEIGKKAKAAGMGRFTYHNHHHEFIKFESDKRTIDILFENLDPEVTSFCLDTHWVQRGGGDVRYWIEKLKGRIDILHLKDFALDAEKTPMFAEIGNGNLYWEGIIDAAIKSGVKYYVVEQDICPGDPFDSLKMSSEYLHKNFM